MNNPDLYQRANEVQRHDAETVIKEYTSMLQWLPEGGDTFIDLGSGSGDVLMDVVYPRMPKNFQRIVCTDINPTMVNFARHKFGHIKGCEFRVLDMAMRKQLPGHLEGQFDHVTSFYALMYARTQRQAFQNIFDLLKSTGGDCLLTSLAYHPAFHVYERLSQMRKWSQYMFDLDSFIPPQQHCPEPRRQIMEYLRGVGFDDYTVEIQSKTFEYSSVESFKTNMMAVNSFIDRIPYELHEEHMDDYMIEIFKEMGLKMDPLDYYGIFPVPYKLLVVYARKSQQVEITRL
ncbi:juvenile hormone acid O-methyltransferase-like [Haematobia irritans]|uniref:juvenile hormone acid O-methyltransferase-like n=1 Tax=Haematobia irritans TaxID=7368 RepID=UPI003F4FEDB1